MAGTEGFGGFLKSAFGKEESSEKKKDRSFSDFLKDAFGKKKKKKRKEDAKKISEKIEI